MHTVDHIKGPFRIQLQRSSFLGFLNQSAPAEYRTELFGPFIAGDFSGQRLQPGSVSTGQYDRPFVFPAAEIRLKGMAHDVPLVVSQFLAGLLNVSFHPVKCLMREMKKTVQDPQSFGFRARVAGAEGKQPFPSAPCTFLSA